eukprot:Sdes_comp10246_c0_seq1m1872
MGLSMRLQRFGNKRNAFYRIVVAFSQSKRDGKFVERIGTYSPYSTKEGTKNVTLNFDKVLYWLSNGAQPTETVRQVLGMSGLLPPCPKMASYKFMAARANGETVVPDLENSSKYFDSNLEAIESYVRKLNDFYIRKEKSTP